LAHGTPDWGLVGPKDTVYGLDDLAEHSVRLGSPVTYDRRGDVIWWTDFRYGRGDLSTFGSAGYTTRLVTEDYPRQGAYCLDCHAPAVAANNSAVIKYLPYPVSSLVGLEASFGVVTNNMQWDLLVRLNQIGGWAEASIRYDTAVGDLSYLDAAGAWQVFANVGSLLGAGGCCNTMKVVIDVVNGEYVRALINSRVFSLAGIGYRVVGGGLGHRFFVTVTARTPLGWELYGYLDSIIVTQNEPA